MKSKLNSLFIALAVPAGAFCVLIAFAVVLAANATFAQNATLPNDPIDALENRPEDYSVYYAAYNIASSFKDLEVGIRVGQLVSETRSRIDSFFNQYSSSHSIEQSLALLRLIRSHAQWRFMVYNPSDSTAREWNGPSESAIKKYTEDCCASREEQLRQQVSRTPTIPLPGQGVEGAIVPGQGVKGAVVPGQDVGGVRNTSSPVSNPEPAKPMFKLTELAKTLNKPISQKQNREVLADAIFDSKSPEKPKPVNSTPKHSFAGEILGDTTFQKADSLRDKSLTSDKGGYRESNGWATEIGQDPDTEIHGTILARLIAVNGLASELKVDNHDSKHAIYISGLGTGSNQYNSGNGRTGQEVAPGTSMRFPLSIYQSKDNPVTKLNFTCQYWRD